MTAQSGCFHCGEPVTTGDRYQVVIDEVCHAVCCPGCQAVACFIRDTGLGKYYEFRTAPGLTVENDPAKPIAGEWRAFDREAMIDRLAQRNREGHREAMLQVEGVRCAACSWLIERALQNANGVVEVHVNPATARARLCWDPDQADFSALLAAIARLGYRPHPIDRDTITTVAVRERRQAMKRLVVAALGMMQVMTFAVALYAGAFQGMDAGIREFLRLVSMLVATPVVLYSGLPFFLGAWRDLRAGRPGMDVPVAFAIGAAYLASIVNSMRGTGEVYFDSVTMFVFFLSLGRFVEMTARHRAGDTSDAIARLVPETALRIDGEDGEARPVGVTELEPGDTVLVRSGESFPADGTLVTSRAHVDESLLTGESRTLRRSPGENVIGGSLNVGDPVHVMVIRTGNETVVSGIGRLLDRAQSTRPAMARTADRVATWFVSAILLIATLVATWWFQHDPARAFEITLAVLVVTCPCALSLATPTALTAATARLAAVGLLVTRSDSIEKLAGVDRLVLDKTGTLTRGRITLGLVQTTGRLDELTCLKIAGALEAGSEHPIASAFQRSGVRPAADVQVMSGEGVEGTVDGRRYRIGLPSFVAQIGTDRNPAGSDTDELSVLLGDEQGILAGFGLEDRLREDASDVVAAISRRGIKLEIASGDRSVTVSDLAATCGIDTFAGRMTPADKLERIRQIQQGGARVAMIGDGINDAPVLAGADVSIAMGEGAALAQSSADMVLVGGALAPLPAGVDTARKAMRVVRQNLSWAILYNAVALPLAAAGLVAPWMAAIGMSASSLVVVLNSARVGRAIGDTTGAETKPGDMVAGSAAINA